MTTLALDIVTGAYPTIANNIETRIYLQSDPLAIVASLNYPAPHPQRVWAYPGLERANYLFRIFEMSGSSIVRQLGEDMDVNPSSNGGVSQRATEQIVADTTIGFTSGVNVVTFDGTDGAEDWRGWDIDTLDLIGSGPMKKGIDYSWNVTTATLTLLTVGAIFNPEEWFNVDFALQITDVTDSVPASIPAFSTPKIIRANYPVSAGGDMGGLLILDPTGVYLEIQLPDLSTVVAGKLLRIEMRRASVNKCVKILTWTGQTIDWLQGGRGDLYICPQESLSLYKFIDITDPDHPVSMWRVLDPNGNWLRLGEQVTDDNVSANVFNKVLMAGADGDVLAQARIYNDHVTQMGGQVCNYDDWATGSNRYKFSLANSAIPGNAGKFKFPDRRNKFERITDGTRLPGDFQDQQLLSHDHVTHGKGPIVQGIINWFLSITNNRYSQGGGTDRIGGKNGSPDTAMRTGDTGGAENRPANIAIRKYLLV